MTLPLSAYTGLSCYYGDFHNHCGISYGHGSLEDAFENAKLQLDFAGVTGHSSWPDIPPRQGYMESIVDYHLDGFRKLENNWDYFCRTTERYNKPGTFITFLSYEVHSLKDGDYTVVFRDPPKNMLKPSSIRELQSYILELNQQGMQCLALPHHIAYKTGFRGINWETFSEEASPLVEIISMHGCSESDDSPFPYLHTMGPRNSRNTMQAGLAMGYHFGITGNTDHHSAHPGSYGFGKTGVWALGLSREHIWEAFQSRRTFALSGDRMILAFTINDAPMGSVILPSEKRHLQVYVKAGYAIDFIEIVKNNRVILRHNISGCQQFGWAEREKLTKVNSESVDLPLVEGGLSTSIFLSPLEKIRGKVSLEVGWGEKGVELLWEVIVKVLGGSLLGIEPRFHGIDIVDPKDKGGNQYRFTSMQSLSDGVAFQTKTWGNPTNTSHAVQGVCLEVEGTLETKFLVDANGRQYCFALRDLWKGSTTEYLGGFLSGALCMHRFIPEKEYTIAFEWEDPLGKETISDFYYLRVSQKNGQWGWSSPIRFREE